MTGARTIGWGTALPENIMTNADLEKIVDTSDEWIVERTGIRQRHIGGTTAGLATEAGRKALEKAGVDPSGIDLLILATTSPDRDIPATASTVQKNLGLECGAFDLNAACSGFVYAMVAGHGFIRSGLERILVIGAETLHQYIDWEDRNTCILFADGAGAAVIERTEGEGELLGWSLSSDGDYEEALYVDRGDKVKMAGREVFRQAVLVMERAGRAAMKQAGLEPSDISVVIPHQANIRIIEASCRRLGIPMEKAIVVLDRTGNTSAASVPLALAEALDTGRINEGDNVLLVGFGAGMSSAAAVLRWGAR